MPESVHGKLSRVRKPRVHITYEVETEGATVVKDLPFVVGVMGDFSGHPTEPLKPLKDRKFVSIDRDSFDDVMKRMTPGVEMRVANTLADDGPEMTVSSCRSLPVKWEWGTTLVAMPQAARVMPMRAPIRDSFKLRCPVLGGRMRMNVGAAEHERTPFARDH
jgi:type VI secretion system protein ImpB